MAGIIARGGSLARDRAGEITCPILLITGEHDELATPDVVRDLAGRIPGAQAVVASGLATGSVGAARVAEQPLLAFLRGA